MQIIGVKFNNSSRVYSCYCPIENVQAGDILLSPDGKAVTVVETDIDPSSIPASVMQILKTITDRAELALQSDGNGSLNEAYVVASDNKSAALCAQADLITVTQLPIIEDQLRSVKADWDARLQNALELPCTPDTVKTVEAIRTAVRKDYAVLDARRKEIEDIASAPIKKFKATFKECISDSFAQIDMTLKERIDTVKDGLRDEKRVAIEAHYGERLQSFGLDFPTFAQSGIKINLSDTDASILKQVDDFTARVAADIDAIKDLPFADEIIVEYKTRLDASYAIKTVNSRHKAMEEVRTVMDITPVSAPAIPVPPPEVPHIVIQTKADDEKTITIQIMGNQRQIDNLLKFLGDSWYTFKVVE